MCTTTSEINNPEITQGVIGFPRDINELFLLKTYQGMTDEEINMIIDYKVMRERVSQQHILAAAKQITEVNGIIEAERESCARMEKMLESMIDRCKPIPTFEQPKSLTFDCTELRHG